jgi:two-component system sensor histidine kinase KdpD
VLLERVFCNLLDNAAKYAPLDTDIMLGAQVVGGELEVTVVNAGAGFPSDKLLAVFEPFERGVTESQHAGVGMGLAICRAVIEAHGGRIAASNPVAGGACVRFTLPLGEPPVIEQEAGESP